jgi:dynein assembly factor 2
MDFQDYRNAPDSFPSTIPKELVVEIELPLLKSAGPVDLDIFEKKLTMKSTEPAKYKLVLDLPYPVDENMGSAKFDKGKRKLCITLPVVRTKESLTVPLMNGHSETFIESPKNGELQDHDSLMTNGTSDDPKPLIEVLSDDYEATAKSEEPVEHESESDPQAASITPHSEPEIMYTLPNYDFHQDDETVSFILHAGRVDRSTLKLSYPVCHAFQLEMSSVGTGGFPIHYRLHVRFPETCVLEIENCRADVDVHNVVVILVKSDNAVGLWEEFEAGPNEDALQVGF